MTYDFARQIDDATEVGTSQFADALIQQIQGGIDLEAKRAQRQAQLAKERKQREIRRLLEPMEEMIASGRTPHTVGEIMTRSLISVPNDTTVEDAMHEMRKNDISCIVVEADDQGQWGIMTRRDIVTKIVRDNKSPTDVTVGEIASRPAISVAPGTSLHDAADVLSDKNISRLLIEQDGGIIGIVTETDIFQTIEEFGWQPE